MPSKLYFTDKWLVSIIPIAYILFSAAFGVWDVLFERYKHYDSMLYINIVWGLMYYLCVGILEEMLTRGIFLNIFLDCLPKSKRGMYISVVLSSFLFGSLHLLNAISSDLFGVFIQVLFATSIGVLFAAIYVRTESLILVILLHGIWDFSQMLDDIIADKNNATNIINSYSFMNVIETLPYLLVGLFLIRYGYDKAEYKWKHQRLKKILFASTFTTAIVITIIIILFVCYVPKLSAVEWIRFKNNYINIFY